MLPCHHEPAATSRNASHEPSEIPPTWWITSPSGAVERWGAISLLALASALGTGCAAVEEEEAPPSSQARPANGTIAPKLYGGSLDSRDESVVALEMNMPDGSKELCSGALLAANVVVTARHCVTPTLTKKVVCSEHGTSENGNHFGDDAPPGTINVFRGAHAQLDATPDAQGKAVVHDDAKVVCDHDVAFLILDRALPNVKPYVIRTGGGVDASEHVNIVGYGKNDVGAALGTRLQKLDVPVLAIGAGTSASKTALGAHEFEVGTGSCGGDSGGPAFSAQTGAIIGVVSRGGDCADDFGHVFVETRGTSDLVTRAFALAGGAALTEQGPQDPVDPAATTAAPHAGGCSAAPSSSPGTTGFAGLAVVAGLAIIRRRRRASC